MKNKQIDWCDKYHASAMARTLTEYWHSRGFKGYKCYTELMPGFDNFWAIRSNLVNGMPPK